MNLRGYPGTTRIPTCQDVSTVAGVTHRKNIPCFQDPRGHITSANGTVATMYTVNHGADTWHVLLAWRHRGGLYSLSEHVAAPYSYKQVLANLQVDVRPARPRAASDMKATRRGVIVGAAGVVAGAAGVYGLVDRLTGAPARPAPSTTPRGPEQHLLDGVVVRQDDGVDVLVPPLHHELVTARVVVEPGDARDAQSALEEKLASLDATYSTTPTGLGVTVAWALPYFERHVPGQWERLQPVDRRARKPALLEGVRFPSDAGDTLLEHNDVVVLLRSDTLDHIAHAEQMLFDEAGVLERTSVRKGFAGGGLPRKMALAAGISGAELIPEEAELFLGFTSTLAHNLGPGKIANFETLGLVDVPQGYFAGGTHMHVSHMYENLETWYLNMDHDVRVHTTFKPGLTVPPGTLTVPQDSDDVSDVAELEHDYRAHGAIGHSSSVQPASRLQQEHTGPDGEVYAKGTAIPQRADFNTLDNPVFWSSDGSHSNEPAAGIHFVVFNPSSDDFNRVRLAMDGVMPDGTVLEFQPRAAGQGFNSVLQTTRRQNFLVPPRRHRSFPLAELGG